MKHLKYDNDVRSKFEAVQIFYYAVSTFRIHARLFMSISQFFKEFYFYVGIVDFKFFVLTDFSSNSPPLRIFHVDTLDDLTKCTRINSFRDLIAISKLFTDLGQIIPVFICEGILVLSPYFTDSVDALVYS